MQHACVGIARHIFGPGLAVNGAPDLGDGAPVTPVPENGAGGQPHQSMQSCAVLNLCIALQGVFPSRS